MNMRVVASILLIAIGTTSRAAELKWVPVTTELLRQEKTGFGGLCGVVVDHHSGDVFVNLSDRGMFRSADQGETWKRASDAQPKGRTETPGCWLLDPTGKSKRMVTAFVYGAPISVSSNYGQSWKSLHADSGHSDWCAVDWTDPKLLFVLTLKHEAGGLLLASGDGGQTFAEVGKGYGAGWVFDNQTAVVATVQSESRSAPQLMRTTDGSKTFRTCGEYSPVGTGSTQALPKWRGDVLYWLTDSGLIATSDKGETWKRIGDVKNAQYGPIFGSSARHMFVLTRAGPVESTDGGASWSSPLSPPNEMNGIGGLSWLEYDPTSDTLYLMKMGGDLYRLARGK